MKLITDSKKINTAIKSIATRGKKLDHDIHLTACSIISHAQEHGDVTLATKMIEAMPKSGRTKTLREWFSKHSPLVWSDKTKQFKMNKGKDAIDFDVDGAIAMPFWTEIEKTQADFDMAKLIKMVASKVSKASNDGQLKDGDIELFKSAMLEIAA